MRINAVSSFNYNAQSNGQKQNFGGILSGVGKPGPVQLKSKKTHREQQLSRIV